MKIQHFYDLIRASILKSFATSKPNSKSERLRPHRPRRIENLETRDMLSATPIAGMSDEFDNAESIAQWQRINEVEGWNADQLQTWDVDATQPGRMTMTPNTVVWFENYRGPMVFKEVSGDFAFTTQVHITDRDDIGGSDANDIPGDASFSLGGVMIRTPRDIFDPATDWTAGSQLDDGTNNGENYVFLSAGYGAPGYGGGTDELSLEVKTTRNSNSQLQLTSLGTGNNVVNIQIARIGTDVFALYQIPGEQWHVHRRYSRPDMPETVQIGLVTYTDWEKANDYDPFYHNGHVLTEDGFNPTPEQPFNPDLVAGFEYARFVRPDVPELLAGIDLRTEATDEQLLSFLGDASNIPVTDQPGFSVPDQSVGHTQGNLEIALPGEIGGHTVTHSARILNSLAAQLNAEHNLFVFHENHAENWGGQQERWLQGDSGYYFILPNGDFSVWQGSFENSQLLGTLDPVFYDDPALLTTAEALPVEILIADNQLTLTPEPDFVGGFEVELTTTFPDAPTVVQTFQVEFANQSPWIDPIADLTIPAGSNAIIDLQLSDADGDDLSIEVEVMSSEAFRLREQYGLHADPTVENWGENWGGQLEKWVRGDGSAWFFLLPDGTLNRWNGSFETSDPVGMLAAEYYADPRLLLDAPGPGIGVEIHDGQLVVNSLLQTGTFEVALVVSDSHTISTTQFSVTLTNQAPVLELNDVSLVAGGTMDIELPTLDADGQPIHYEIEVIDPVLDSLNVDFVSQGSFYDNYLGHNERWLRSTSGQWYYLLEDGNLYLWNNSFDESGMIAELGMVYFENPQWLIEPPVPAVSATFENGFLTLMANETFQRPLQLRITATDGVTPVEQTVLISPDQIV